MKYRDYDPIEALHKIRHRDPFGGVNPPNIHSTTYDLDPLGMAEIFDGTTGPSDDHYAYARLAQSNNVYLGCQISAVENAEWTETFASGQGAMVAVVDALTKVGDTVVASTRMYGGTLKLLRKMMSKGLIKVVFVDITDLEMVKRVLTEHRPKLFLAEAISNPSLVPCDIEMCAKIAHQHGALFVVDNTFTPLVVLPLRLGADIVVHSLTKYVSGKSDGMGGSVSLHKKLPADIKTDIASYLALHGAVLDLSFGHVLSMRLPSMWHAYKAASDAAMHAAVKMRQGGLQVYYPGLPSFTHRAVVKKIFRTTDLGYGGMIAVDFGTRDEAIRFVRKVRKEKIGYSAVSLGSNHLYVCAPVSSVSSGIDEELPAELTVSLVRISVGDNMPPELLWKNLSKAL